MKKKKYLILGWLLTIIITILWTYENPEKIKNVKNKLKLYKPKNNFQNPKKDITKNIFNTNNFTLKLQ